MDKLQTRRRKSEHVAEQGGPEGLRPDIVIMDLCMPSLNGTEAARHIWSEFPHIKVVGEYIRLSSQNNCHLLGVLSAKEREVLRLMAEGRTTKQIALDLHVSTKTIEANRRMIMEKLDIHNVPGLVKLAVREGLTPLE